MITKEQKFVSLSNDLLFKETLTHYDNKDKLIYFLSCFTDFSKDFLENSNLVVQYESIFTKTKLNDKSYRGDVVIKFANFRINLECYSSFNEASFNKSTSYIMRVFSTQVDRGINSNYLESIIQLNFIDDVNYSFDPNIISVYGLTNLNNIQDRKLADKFVIKYFRLDKARIAPYNESDKALLWLKFIGAKSHKERALIAKGDELLMELNNWIDEYVNDERTKELFGKWAEQIEKDKAIQKSEQKGFKKGAKKEKIAIAKNLIKLDTPLENIHLATGLTIEEIKKLTKLSNEKLEENLKN